MRGEGGGEGEDAEERQHNDDERRLGGDARHVGFVLGALTCRSGSVVPAMIFHLVHNSALVVLGALAQSRGTAELVPPGPPVGFLLQALCLVGAFLVLWRLVRGPLAAPRAGGEGAV